MKILLMSALMVVLAGSVSLAQDQALSAIDKDSDGKVTTAEFKSYVETLLPQFDQMDDFVKRVDADGNGEISEAEFGKRMEAMQAVRSGEPAPKKEAEKEEAKGPLAVGDMASDFELQSIDKTIKLSDNFGDEGKPVVVVFSRANW